MSKSGRQFITELKMVKFATTAIWLQVGRVPCSQNIGDTCEYARLTYWLKVDSGGRRSRVEISCLSREGGVELPRIESGNIFYFSGYRKNIHWLGGITVSFGGRNLAGGKFCDDSR
jgi:hypothetical protein